MQGDTGMVFEGDATAAQLDRAFDNLEEALEEMDLEHDRELADAMVAAVSATDRARQLQLG